MILYMTLTRPRPKGNRRSCQGMSSGELTVALILAISLAILTYRQVNQDAMRSTPDSRRRICHSNQIRLKKLVGVWESEYVALPAGQHELKLRWDLNGELASGTSVELSALTTEPQGLLAAGSRVFRRYESEASRFRCPEREFQAGVAAGLRSTSTVDYEFRLLPSAQLNAPPVRAVHCLGFGIAKPSADSDDTLGTDHRMDTRYPAP